MKTVDEYLALPYAVNIRKDARDDIFVARVAELPGCSAHGQTPEEALANVRDNMAVWIEDCLEAGNPIPLPQVEEPLPSGKWLQRTSRSLHLKLIKLAKQEGVSLNQLVTSLLAEAVGEKTVSQPDDANRLGLLRRQLAAERALRSIGRPDLSVADGVVR